MVDGVDVEIAGDTGSYGIPVAHLRRRLSRLRIRLAVARCQQQGLEWADRVCGFVPDPDSWPARHVVALTSEIYSIVHELIRAAEIRQ